MIWGRDGFTTLLYLFPPPPRAPVIYDDAGYDAAGTSLSAIDYCFTCHFARPRTFGGRDMRRLISLMNTAAARTHFAAALADARRALD